MKYEFNGKVLNIPDDEIKLAMKNLDCSEEEAIKAYNECNSLLDKAVSEHIKHKNYAARQKARLAKLVNGLN